MAKTIDPVAILVLIWTVIAVRTGRYAQDDYDRAQRSNSSESVHLVRLPWIVILECSLSSQVPVSPFGSAPCCPSCRYDYLRRRLCPKHVNRCRIEPHIGFRTNLSAGYPSTRGDEYYDSYKRSCSTPVAPFASGAKRPSFFAAERFRTARFREQYRDLLRSCAIDIGQCVNKS